MAGRRWQHSQSPLKNLQMPPEEMVRAYMNVHHIDTSAGIRNRGMLSMIVCYCKMTCGQMYQYHTGGVLFLSTTCRGETHRRNWIFFRRRCGSSSAPLFMLSYKHGEKKTCWPAAYFEPPSTSNRITPSSSQVTIHTETAMGTSLFFSLQMNARFCQHLALQQKKGLFLPSLPNNNDIQLPHFGEGVSRSREDLSQP